MYMHHEIRYVAEHRQTEALGRIHMLHSLMGVQPDFIRTLSCRYLGRPDRYAWFRFWTRPEGNTNFRATPEAKEFAASRPDPDIYYQPADAIVPNGHWLTVAEPVGRDLGNYIVRYGIRVPAGNESSFLADRREFERLTLATDGLTWSVTFKCNEPDSDLYVTFLRGMDREALNRFLEGPNGAAYRAQPKDGLYETLTAECYKIVDEITPASGG